MAHMHGRRRDPNHVITTYQFGGAWDHEPNQLIVGTAWIALGSVKDLELFWLGLQ